MPYTDHSINVIDRLLSADISSINRLIEMQHLVSFAPYVSNIDKVIYELPFEKYKDEEEKTIMLKLYQIQLCLLYSGDNLIDYNEIETTLKSIQLNEISIGKSVNNQSENNNRNDLLYLRIKYNDILTDYNYLLNPSISEYKFIELINKKLIILNNVSIDLINSENSINWFVQTIRYKILINALLSGTDFRKKNTLKYLIDSNFDIDKDSIKSYFELTYNNKFIPFKLFEKFLEEIKELDPVYAKIIKTNRSQLINNYLENNINKLSNYYESIYLSKISELFYDIGTENIEDLIQQMIIKNKLPLGSSIDQINELVIFNNKLDVKPFDKINNHIKGVNNLVNEASNLIDADK